jgi:uncharacterized tellurite resistance protein B-like protein
MIGKLKNILLGDAAFADTAADDADRRQLALAALLVEMARADFDESHDEHSLIIDLLSDHFGLTSAESLELLQRSREANDRSVCLFDFTRALHESLDEQQKNEVIRLLWQIAMADSRIDKYEDSLVRKIAGLLYVSDHDVIRIRHEVLETSSSAGKSEPQS